jgi:hypothetical protein
MGWIRGKYDETEMNKVRNKGTKERRLICNE